jgi:3-oxoacyl-[acyl-carrier protein] reductase
VAIEVTSTPGVLDIDDARFDSTVDMTLRSTFLCTQAFGRGMVERGFGRIINIGSISMNGAAGQADYAGLKAAVVGFTRTCAIELAPAVTVNAVIPGVIETSVMERLGAEALEEYAARIPLRRWGRPEDVAGAVAFLASEHADYITGEDLYVSGGFRSWI